MVVLPAPLRPIKPMIVPFSISKETFFRLISKAPRFENAEHEKAWLIRTASNICKNELKNPRRRHEDIDEHTELQDGEPPQTDDVLRAVMGVP